MPLVPAFGRQRHASNSTVGNYKSWAKLHVGTSLSAVKYTSFQTHLDLLLLHFFKGRVSLGWPGLKLALQTRLTGNLKKSFFCFLTARITGVHHQAQNDLFLSSS